MNLEARAVSQLLNVTTKTDATWRHVELQVDQTRDHNAPTMACQSKVCTNSQTTRDTHPSSIHTKFEEILLYNHYLAEAQEFTRR